MQSALSHRGRVADPDPVATPDPAVPACAIAASTHTLAATRPALAANLGKLDAERFKAVVSHSDNDGCASGCTLADSIADLDSSDSSGGEAPYVYER